MTDFVKSHWKYDESFCLNVWGNLDQSSGISPCCSPSTPFALTKQSHDMISKEHLTSHLTEPLKPNKFIRCALQASVCYPFRNRESLPWLTAKKSSWLTEQWEQQEEQGACMSVCVCVVGATPAHEPPPPPESESASHPSFLQGGPSSWQKNAWEWAPSIKATLFQSPRMALGFTFHRFTTWFRCRCFFISSVMVLPLGQDKTTHREGGIHSWIYDSPTLCSR